MKPIKSLDTNPPVSESLQDYAARTGRSVVSAYQDWHNAGKRVAQAWQLPSTAPLGFETREHATIQSGRVLGLQPDDVRALAKPPRVGREAGAFEHDWF